MRSHTTARFRKAFQQLPGDVQQQAREAFRAWRNDPHHRSLRFRQVHSSRPVYSVRIGIHYRALAVKEGQDMIWFWVGPHADYDNLVSQR